MSISALNIRRIEFRKADTVKHTIPAEFKSWEKHFQPSRSCQLSLGRMTCLEINNKDLHLFCIILTINVCDANRETGGEGGGPCLGGAVVGENLHVAPFCFKYQELYFYLNELLTERTYLYGVDVTITSHHLFKSRVRPNPSCHWMHNAESVSRIISTFHIDNKLKKKPD